MRSINVHVIWHINMNRLRHKLDSVKHLIMKHQFPILAVTETWQDYTVGDGEVVINNYRLF